MLDTSAEVAEGDGKEEVPPFTDVGVGFALVVRKPELVAVLVVLFRLWLVVGNGGRILLIPVPENDECTLLNPVPDEDERTLLTAVPGKAVCMLLNAVPGKAVCMLLTPVPGKIICVLPTVVLREVELGASPVPFLREETPAVPSATVTRPVETAT